MLNVLFSFNRSLGIEPTSQDRAGSAVEQGLLDAVVGQDFAGAVEGVAFAEGAEVEVNRGRCKADLAVRGIEVNAGG